jgi:hypothetical protein
LVIELLKGVKEVYSKADQHGKQKFLDVLVKEIFLKKEPVVVWQEPFDTLFALGEVFREKGIWGELVDDYVTYLRHESMAGPIGQLGTAPAI